MAGVLHLIRESNKRGIVLIESGMKGGQGTIYRPVDNAYLLAKVYNDPTANHAPKLRTMLAQPPKELLSGGHPAVAWPIEILRRREPDNQVVGFLMPHMKDMHSIIDFYTPSTRKKLCPAFNYVYLHRTARNLAAIFHGLHVKNYVIGDVKEANVLVSDSALVSLIDVDSFQVKHRGITYRCTVGTPQYTPPELISGQDFKMLDRSPLHDLFGLGVLIFQLLMEGAHPFMGVYNGPGEPPPIEERIARGYFPHGVSRSTIPILPPLFAPPFKILHPKLQDLFRRCFVLGHSDPSARPSALTWQTALEEAERDLKEPHATVL